MVEETIITLSDVVLNSCKGSSYDNLKWGRVKKHKGGKFSTLTWTSKMMTPIHCDDIYNVIPRRTTNILCKEMQEDMLKILQIKWNSKKCSSNPQDGRKKKTEKQTQRKDTENKTKKLNLDISVTKLNINGLYTLIKGQGSAL